MYFLFRVVRVCSAEGSLAIDSKVLLAVGVLTGKGSFIRHKWLDAY